jgi:hypothetical protein
VDVAAGTIRDNILPLPYKEPSQVLLGLMNQIVEEGRRFAAAADLKIADMSANSPVGTTLAILERTLKVMSAVQARIHYAMKQELKLLKDIIRDYTPDEYDYQPVEGTPSCRRSLTTIEVDVIPVSDPNSATMAQKVVQYQAVMQMAAGNPQIYDMVELNRQMLEVLGIKNIGKLVPSAEDQKPKDPVIREHEHPERQTREGVHLSGSRGTHHGAYERHARSEDCAAHRPKPEGADDSGCNDGSHQRAHRLPVPHGNREAARRTAPGDGQRTCRKRWRSRYLA